MCAHGRTDSIAGTIARERHATDGVVTIHVGICRQGELILRRHVIGDFHVDDFSMVSIRDATRLRVVISYGLISNTLIKLIIQVETILTARQRVIIVLLDLVVCQFLCPEATFVDDTRISLVINSAISIPKSRFRQVIPICRQNGINHLICTWI